MAYYPPYGGGYPPQGGYPSQTGYTPQGGYALQVGYPPQGGYVGGYPASGGGVNVVDAKRVALHNNHENVYLMAEHGSLMLHHDLHHPGLGWGPDKSHKGQFFIEPHGQHIAIRTCHGQYIAVGQAGQVYVTNTPHEWDAKFVQEWHPEHNGRFGFRSYHGRYLGARNKQVIAWHEFTKHELWAEQIMY